MSERKDHWENIYQNKSPLEVSWYQQEPTLSLGLIDHCRLDKDQPIIDVGGGASVLVDRLLTRGFNNLSVLDISAQALLVTQQRLGQQADRVNWIVTDITEFQPEQHFSLWHDRAVFHFLTDPADRASYIAALHGGLKPGAHLILAAFAIGGPTKCSGLDIVQYDSDKLCKTLGDDFELLETASEIHLTPAGGEQAFQYYRLIRK